MKHNTSLLALTALSLTLTACGGNGGGSETRSATPIINQPSHKAASTNTQNTQAGSTTVNSTSKPTTTNTTTHKPATHTNSTANPKAMNVVTDYQGDKELLVNRPADHLVGEVKKVLEDTNKLRAEKGLPPLKLNDNLSAYAQQRASELHRLFEHQRPDGQAWNVGLVGGVAGENLAAGAKTGDKAVRDWKNSQGHYESIMDSKYTNIGIGVVHVPNSPYGYYWVQVFGQDETKSPYSFTDNHQAQNNTPLSTVIVKGVPISVALSRAGVSRTFERTSKLSDGNQVVHYTGWVNGYDNSRFGAVKYNTAKNTDVFYQGFQTPEQAIPQSGAATYRGEAVIVKGNQRSTGESKFDVNFANKTLAGEIAQNRVVMYRLSANIQGSGFASKAGESVATEGAFFGKNAEELGGIFKDATNDTKGAFGAKKDK